MYNFVPVLTFIKDGKKVKSDKLENELYTLDISINEGELKCVLHPKREFQLFSFALEAKRALDDDEVFFVNGFQSWSTCQECKKGDLVADVVSLANISPFTRRLATMSGDYHFTTYGEQGRFHSFTYTYFRRGDFLELFGSANERTGYTIFEIEGRRGIFRITKDVEGVTAKEDYELLNVRSFKGTYDEVFDSYFSSLNLRKPKIEHLSGYTSWYNYFQKIDERIILRDLDGLDRAKEDVSIFQVDDGYETYVGDWLDVDRRKFPNGMKNIADKIHAKGYLAGIWIAPFSVQRVSKIAKEHPDWLIRNKKGKKEWGCFAWGGAYTIDIYNPQVREYIKHFFDVILNDWGYDMVKLDFLYSEATEPRCNKSRGQIMCEAMDFLRECVGEEKLILGCGMPLGPGFGVVDACRISCDVDLDYDGKFYNKFGVNREIPSAQNAINNTIYRRHLNGRVFCNDPDVFFLRDDNLTFTWEQKELLATVNNMFGDVLFVSDNAGDYGDKELAMLKKSFVRNSADVHSTYMTDSEVFEIKYTDDSGDHTFAFNIKTGKIISR